MYIPYLYTNAQNNINWWVSCESGLTYFVSYKISVGATWLGNVDASSPWYKSDFYSTVIFHFAPIKFNSKWYRQVEKMRMLSHRAMWVERRGRHNASTETEADILSSSECRCVRSATFFAPIFFFFFHLSVSNYLNVGTYVPFFVCHWSQLVLRSASIFK